MTLTLSRRPPRVEALQTLVTILKTNGLIRAANEFSVFLRITENLLVGKRGYHLNNQLKKCIFDNAVVLSSLYQEGLVQKEMIDDLFTFVDTCKEEGYRP